MSACIPVVHDDKNDNDNADTTKMNSSGTTVETTVTSGAVKFDTVPIYNEKGEIIRDTLIKK